MPLKNVYFIPPAIFLILFTFFGVTGGAHRLWSHRSYKAKWPLRLYAAFGQTFSAQVNKLFISYNF